MFTKAYERKLERLGAFEIANDMLKLARNNERHITFLNAGRGNPNWVNTQGRLAFCRLMEFGVSESRRTLERGTLAGSITKDGIAGRLDAFLDGTNESDAFLREAITWAQENLGLDADSLVSEFANAIVGNNYPVPSRCLENIEVILNAFLQSALYRGTDLASDTQVFPTEGGTAAICYIFDALKHNGLIEEGDRIAINTPIFTPYIQIPRLTNFQLTELDLEASEERNWHYDPKEFDRLLDPKVKAFFLVNPSNPGSHSLSEESLDKLAEIVKERPDLIIITDDVYGTFVNGFKTVYAVAPHNTLLVYSFSKLYGVTGWRLGCIAANKDNVFDSLIKKLPAEKLAELDSDYSIVSLKPRELSFIDRICADSRSIGLYHTSGLSTPQQAIMALFALTHLVTKATQSDAYVDCCKGIVSSRYHDLCSNLGIEEDDSDSNSKYYSLIDIYRIAERIYDQPFSEWLRENFEQVDFLVRLAEEDGVVLMEGVGFAATPGTLRVSEANLPDAAYQQIAKRVLDLLGEYHERYLSSSTSTQ